MFSLTALTAALVGAEPNTCQPRSSHPFLPIYHIIGNVTSDPKTGEVTNLESINDVSSTFLYKGIYHGTCSVFALALHTPY